MDVPQTRSRGKKHGQAGSPTLSATHLRFVTSTSFLSLFSFSNSSLAKTCQALQLFVYLVNMVVASYSFEVFLRTSQSLCDLNYGLLLSYIQGRLRELPFYLLAVRLDLFANALRSFQGQGN